MVSHHLHVDLIAVDALLLFFKRQQVAADGVVFLSPGNRGAPFSLHTKTTRIHIIDSRLVEAQLAVKKKCKHVVVYLTVDNRW